MRTQMKSAPMILARSLGWLRSYKIRIAVVSTILVVAALQLRTRFLDSYCESITEGISSVASALSGTVGRELECIFGTRSDIEAQKWTVIWPMFERGRECACPDDKFSRSLVWPRFKENGK